MSNKRGKMSRRVKNTRRRNKKRNGGASGASEALGVSASSPKLTRTQKPQRLLGNPRDSAMLSSLSNRLLEPPSGILPPPRYVKEKMSNTIESRVKTKRVGNELFKMAEHLHATSFRYRTSDIIADGDLQRCIDANVEAVKQLREAVDKGSFQAHALLADILLNGHIAGVSKNVRVAKKLVSQVQVANDPDCQGILAHCHFNDGIKAGLGLATQSASAGSKYGQYVLGLYEMQKDKPNEAEASDYFKLAAEQNYDEAQIALSKFKIQSDPDEALRLLNLAADQGNADAFYSIAEIYRRKSKDNPTTMAFRDAMEWCNLAADANHPYAYDTLISMQRKLERSY